MFSRSEGVRMSQSPDKIATPHPPLAPAASTILTSPWTLRGTQTTPLGFLLGKHPPEVHPEIKKIQVCRPLGVAQDPAVRLGSRALTPVLEVGSHREGPNRWPGRSWCQNRVLMRQHKGPTFTPELLLLPEGFLTFPPFAPWSWEGRARRRSHKPPWESWPLPCTQHRSFSI